jgi:hypothetical protein
MEVLTRDSLNYIVKIMLKNNDPTVFFLRFVCKRFTSLHLPKPSGRTITMFLTQNNHFSLLQYAEMLGYSMKRVPHEAVLNNNIEIFTWSAERVPVRRITIQVAGSQGNFDIIMYMYSKLDACPLSCGTASFSCPIAVYALQHKRNDIFNAIADKGCRITRGLYCNILASSGQLNLIREIPLQQLEKFGNCMLAQAIRGKQLECVEYLIDKFEEELFHIRGDIFGQARSRNTFELLLSRGFIPSIRSLHSFVRHCSLEDLQWLILESPVKGELSIGEVVVRACQARFSDKLDWLIEKYQIIPNRQLSTIAIKYSSHEATLFLLNKPGCHNLEEVIEIAFEQEKARIIRMLVCQKILILTPNHIIQCLEKDRVFTYSVLKSMKCPYNKETCDRTRRKPNIRKLIKKIGCICHRRSCR